MVPYGMARTQTLVQLNDKLLALLDEEASRQQRSRSALIREAIERYLSNSFEAEIDRRIVEGYTRVPQQDDPWIEAAARASIAQEPW